MHEVTVICTFSAAHSLRGYRGKCESLHGHNWRIEVTAAADELDALGMVLDFQEFKAAVVAVLDELDHHYLNEIPPFTEINPSSEHLARHVAAAVGRRVNTDRVRVVRCRVWESDNAYSTFLP